MKSREVLHLLAYKEQPEGRSIAQSSQRHYGRIVESLRRRTQAYLASDVEALLHRRQPGANVSMAILAAQQPTPLDIAKFALRLSSTHRPSTHRVYCAALKWDWERICALSQTSAEGMQSALAANAAAALDWLELGREDETIREALRQPKPRRTSAQTRKWVTAAELSALLIALLRAKSAFGFATFAWLVAGAETGKRPHEVVLRANPAWLVIRNAKHGHGRAHGSIRRVPLDHLTERYKAIILDHVAQLAALRASEDEKAYARFDASCRKLLWRTVRRLWPRAEQRPNRYSMRHFFISNAKAAGVAKTAIAALIGHSSTVSQNRHYGKRRHGRGGLGIEAHEADVAAVIRCEEERLKRRERARAQAAPGFRRPAPAAPKGVCRRSRQVRSRT